MKIRAVLDTSVLLSADRHELLYYAHKRIYTFLWSAFLIGECVRVRTELAIKHGQEREVYRARINAFIHEATCLASIVDYTRLEGGNYNEWLNDPDDEPLLAAALVGKAGYVVSWNTRDFPPNGVFAGVRYLTPPDFYQVLNIEYPRRKLKDTFDTSNYRVP